MATSLIPAMTSATNPAPYVVSSTQPYPTHPAWHAFDKSAGTYWSTGQGTLTGWLAIDLGAAQQADLYRITSPAGVNRTPNTWTLEGSSDASTWTILDTRSGVTWPTATMQEFTVATPGSYRHYRLNVTANNGDTYYLQIAELDLLAAGATTTTGTLAAALPKLTGSLAASYIPPPVDASLAGVLPALTASFAGSLPDAPVDATLVGVLPRLASALAATFTTSSNVATDSVNRRNGMTLVTEWQVEVEPPVTEPKRQRAHDYAIAVSLTEPTLVDGRPT